MADFFSQTHYKDFVDLLNNKTYTSDENLSFYVKSAKERIALINQYIIKDEKEGELLELEFALNKQKHEYYLKTIKTSYVVHKNNDNILYIIGVDLFFNEDQKSEFSINIAQKYNDKIDFTYLSYMDNQFYEQNNSLTERVSKDSVMYKYDELFKQLDQLNNSQITEMILTSFLYQKSLLKEELEFINITHDVVLDMSFVDEKIKPTIHKIS